MALRNQFPALATFSMSSMTDIIFLLLIFFMVTSTIIFPTALEVNLPQSSEQTSLKPVTEVYVDSLSRVYIVADRNDSVNPANREPRAVDPAALAAELSRIHATDSLRAVALYADTRVDYGRVVEILDLASRRGMKMVLATRAADIDPELGSSATDRAPEGMVLPARSANP